VSAPQVGHTSFYIAQRSPGVALRQSASDWSGSMLRGLPYTLQDYPLEDGRADGMLTLMT
jgi:hypothetical protein